MLREVTATQNAGQQHDNEPYQCKRVGRPLDTKECNADAGIKQNCPERVEDWALGNVIAPFGVAADAKHPKHAHRIVK